MSAGSALGALRPRQLRSSGTVVVECSGKGEAQVRLYLEANSLPANEDSSQIYQRQRTTVALKMTESQRLVYVFRQAGLFNTDPTLGFKLTTY